MRLRKIKLSGFKSFVDPTTLIVPANLVGIVGPNGCGKSNIIDAVTWVMGESSAKHLRGESLTDVIFNGSTGRQPVSQAMVELVFDNSEGRAAGQYASYSEIAIKRQINREGISSYYLNGTRCRRKDIHGIFLGTGLGPRGYSIIEQGMISRLIEAKPDELRMFIEEAAGISRYREKRRETENRMQHTRENLDRLNDIREELGKQLNHLQRQAKAAERYQVLKAEERRLRAELLSLNYRDLQQEVSQRDDRVREQETRVEQTIADLRRIEAEIEARRDEQTGANEQFNRIQSDYYQVGSEISQLEQKIEYSSERVNSLGGDIAKVEAAIRQTEEQHSTDREKLAALEEKVRGLEPQLQGSRSESNRAYDALSQAEQAMQNWQQEWDAFRETESGFRQQIEVCQTRLTHLREGLSEVAYRRESLTAELESAERDQLEGELADLESSVSARTAELGEARAALETRQNEVRLARTQVTGTSERLGELKTRQQKIEGTLAGLVSLQKGTVEGDQGRAEGWLETLGKAQAARVYEAIHVEPEWAHALETVLGQHLQSVVIDEFDKALGALGDLGDANLGIVWSGNGETVGAVATADQPRLLDRVRCEGTSLAGMLAGVWIADDIQAALAVYPRLGPTETVVTRDGTWMGRGWVRINRTSEEDSVLLREQRIQALKSENDALLAAISEAGTQLHAARAAQEAAEAAQQGAEQSLRAHQEHLNDIQARYAGLRARSDQVRKRAEQIGEEIESLQDREEAGRDEAESLDSTLERTRRDLESLSEQKDQLMAQRQRHQELLDNARTNWQTTHELSHEFALQLESMSSQKASLEQAIRRNEIQLGNHRGQLADLQRALEQVKAPLAGLREQLEARLSARREVEKNLSQARDAFQTIDAAIRQLEQQRSAAEQLVEEARSVLEKLRLEFQEVKVRLETVSEQLTAEEHQPEQILAEIEEGATKQEWQDRIVKTEQKIQRLGPINLAAIDEYTQLSERKEYLDRQNDDLNEALATLENAIRKIDKETRTRFKETFDKLNANLKDMFPVLFGGGQAWLEMTGNDLLDTGVSIIARPPGKKNSSIHLLSGGEKALTAVALVFAIFKLNPAPFCILDEVDAPLDDTNAGRFSELLGQMSSDVQFLFITHNKITMEIAQQLLGVTMHEPGVSRLVTVDIEEAVKLAAIA